MPLLTAHICKCDVAEIQDYFHNVARIIIQARELCILSLLWDWSTPLCLLPCHLKQMKEVSIQHHLPTKDNHPSFCWIHRIVSASFVQLHGLYLYLKPSSPNQLFKSIASLHFLLLDLTEHIHESFYNMLLCI